MVQKLQAVGWRLVMLWAWMQARLSPRMRLGLALGVAVVLFGVQYWLLPVYVVVLVGQGVVVLRL